MADQPKKPSEMLAKQVKTWRDRRKLSAQALADRIADLGGSLSRVAISKIENGDRGVSLDEWLQLAHALAVPPPMLFIDLQGGDDIAVTPAVVLHPWLVWEWATGQQPPLVAAAPYGAQVSRVEEFGQAQTAIRLYQREGEAARLINHAASDIQGAKYIGDNQAEMGAKAGFLEALRQLATVLDEMIDHGIAPPGKPAEWIERIREYNFSRYPDRLSIAVRQGADDGER